MKNCWIVLGAISFSIGFGLGVVTERNFFRGIATGAIATFSSVGSALAVEKKSLNQAKVLVTSASNSELDTLDDYVEQLKAAKIVLQQKNQVFQNEIHRLEEKCSNLVSEKINLQSQLQNLQAEYTSATFHISEERANLNQRNQKKSVAKPKLKQNKSKIQKNELEVEINNIRHGNNESKLEQQDLEENKGNVLLEFNSKRLKRLQFSEQDSDYVCNLSNRVWTLYKHNVQFYKTVVQNPVDRTQDWRNLERGVQIIENQRGLLAYFAFYGGMHLHKMNYLIEKLFDFNNFTHHTIVDLIDYGCGQALGSSCLLDHLNRNPSINISIDKIILIEPSEVSIKRGVFHLDYLTGASQNPDILPIQKTITELKVTDLSVTQGNHVKIHILSNILDVLELDEINHLVNCIHASQAGSNYFICVSPRNHGRVKIDKFREAMQSNLPLNKGTKIDDFLVSNNPILNQEWWVFTRDEFVPKEITRVQRLFSVTYANDQ